MSKLKKKRFFSGGYESEIKITIILLIGFFLSLNFISAYSLGKARLALNENFKSRIKLGLKSVKKVIEVNNLSLPETAYLNEILTLTDLNQIEILDSLGSRLMAVSALISESSENLISKSAVIKSKTGQTVYYINVHGVNRVGNNLNRLAVFDNIFRIAGLIIGLIIAYLFIRSVMNPYKKIKKEASALDFPQLDYEDVDSVEYAVKMFQEVIRELKQKEKLLQSMYDISEKRADSLAQYNEHILSSISSGAIICDNQGIITRFNRAAEKIIGNSQHYVQGKHYAEVFGENHHIAMVLNEALNNDKIFSRTEFEITRENGDSLWIGLTSSLISDNENNKIGAAALLTDLTKIKQLQQVSDFTEKMAALGEMSAGLAHELRNSIAAILGFSKLLKKLMPPDDKASSIAQSIISESLATEEMISRFLTFAKPLNIQPSRIEIRNLVYDSLKMAVELHQDKQISISVDDQSGDIAINADPILLKNALSNLMINACQAMDDSGILNVGLTFNSHAKQVIISISDTGKGISKENLPKIFNPFFTTREKGTGLGLSLVRKIITGHMGTIEVESKEREGTIFTIILPVDLTIEQNSNKIEKEKAASSIMSVTA
ncbi:MAG: PAS domain S-box protein [candidate division Zixibacteria bacterium]|nr:PAS domain S-box protein [candidate division Zixibacteria bacterium]